MRKTNTICMNQRVSLAIRYSPPGTEISKYNFTGNFGVISASYGAIYSAFISAAVGKRKGKREGQTTVILTAVYTGINWGAVLPL